MMIRIKLVLQKHDTLCELCKDVSENINWDELEYIMSQTDEFRDLGLYYHGAKLWHLVDLNNHNNRTIIKDNYVLKNVNMIQHNTLEIYLAWEEDEYPDSP